MLRSATSFVLLLLIAGCAAKQVQVHPGSISAFDSYAYDLLLTEQAVIGQARADFVAGKLPPQAKTPLNTAIKQYNVAQAAWQAYHAQGGDAPALQQMLNTLVSAVAELQKVLGQKTEPTVPIADLRPAWRFA